MKRILAGFKTYLNTFHLPGVDMF